MQSPQSMLNNTMYLGAYLGQLVSLSFINRHSCVMSDVDVKFLVVLDEQLDVVQVDVELQTADEL